MDTIGQQERERKEREQRERERQRREERERERQQLKEQQAAAATERPPVVPSKSAPAISESATQPAAGAVAGPPPVKPLQTMKKKELPAPDVTVTAPEAEDPGIAAAAEALQKKPKEKEKRISTMTEAQIMEKLRSVVSPDDPKTLYSKIKKVGQG